MDAASRRQGALLGAVEAGGGVVRRARMVEAGHTQRTIASAVSDGKLVAIRRRWVATPHADAHLVAAARGGVVVSCVTQARRLGLWVEDADAPPHVAASSHAGRVNVVAGTRVHRGRPLILRHQDALEDPIENVLALVCGCLPFESALATVESALNKRLVDKQQLLELPLSASMRRIVVDATPFSDSGLETFVVPRLRWMKLRIVPQLWIAGRPVDFLIGERLVLQIDGGHHVGRQRAGDNAHDATLRLMGYHVIRVGYIQMMEDWPTVQLMIQRAVAAGLHLARA